MKSKFWKLGFQSSFMRHSLDSNRIIKLRKVWIGWLEVWIGWLVSHCFHNQSFLWITLILPHEDSSISMFALCYIIRFVGVTHHILQERWNQNICKGEVRRIVWTGKKDSFDLMFSFWTLEFPFIYGDAAMYFLKLILQAYKWCRHILYKDIHMNDNTSWWH